MKKLIIISLMVIGANVTFAQNLELYTISKDSINSDDLSLDITGYLNLSTSPNVLFELKNILNGEHIISDSIIGNSTIPGFLINSSNGEFSYTFSNLTSLQGLLLYIKIYNDEGIIEEFYIAI